MSTLSEFAGRIPAKQPEKFGFSQTCSLLSQYLKENKAALGELNLTGTPEVFRQIVAPMNLFPENPIADPTPKSQLTQIQKSMNVLPQFARSGGKMSDATAEEPKAAQMTIFYAGQVIVFNDFPADKAKEVLLLASKGSNSQVFAPQPTLAPKIQINSVEVEPNTRGLPPSSVINNPVQDCLPRPVEQIVSDLPIARRNSLHRFLEKRKDRITAKSPYPVAGALSWCNWICFRSFLVAMEAEAAPSRHKRDSSVGSVASGSPDEKRELFEFFGWVFHHGFNSIGHEYCHLRFLFIRGKHVEMYKRDPSENPDIKPIRRGVISPSLMVEELGRRKVNDNDIYIIRFYNRQDERKKGEIACATAGEAKKWMEAFDHARQQAVYELSKGGGARDILNVETEINLEGHRPRVRRYAHELKKLIRIGQGPETLLRRSSNVGDMYFHSNAGDAIEANNWKCLRTIKGARIFEDIADSKAGKGVLVKAVAVIEASADTVFEVILNLERNRRYEWDNFSGDLELIDSYDGHYDVLYGTFEPKYPARWNSRKDFVFSRQWFHAQDGTYTIIQLPAVHKKRPSRSGYKRITVNPSIWEIRTINTPMGMGTSKCLVTQMMEIQSAKWCKWMNDHSSKFEKTVPYALLCQVSGLKKYVEANPALKTEISVAISQAKISDMSGSNSDYEDLNEADDDEFYDAMSSGSSSSEESDDEKNDVKVGKVRLKNVSWAIAGMTLKKKSVADAHEELDPHVAPISINPNIFHGSLAKGKDDSDTNCWSSPSGSGFVIRGKDYLRDNSKVKGSDPLLQLIGVDWLKVEDKLDSVALGPKSLVQSEAGKKLPFILIVNLQIPAKPNYSLVCYYASDRPVNKTSLLGEFIDGTDAFRDARFKLIPSIIEGYWMVKRTVGTKACLLGKAVTCNYLRQDNFLEIDVDIGSSSVARSVIGLVLGYVTSIVVDLAILIEAKEEAELPEYILGTVRLNRLRPDSAV